MHPTLNHAPAMPPTPEPLQPKTAPGPYPEEGEEKLIPEVRQRMGEWILATHTFRGDETIVVPRDVILKVMQILRDEEPFRMEYLMDLTVVDRLFLGGGPRFEVVYHLYSLSKNHRIRVKTLLPEEDPVVDSLTGLWASANWMEREAWDLYGVRFEGHPDLRRILLYPEFVGHPLRKDYPKEGEQPRIPLYDHRPWPRPKPPDIR